jgi:hypothetical protein
MAGHRARRADPRIAARIWEALGDAAPLMSALVRMLEE